MSFLTRFSISLVIALLSISNIFSQTYTFYFGGLDNPRFHSSTTIEPYQRLRKELQYHDFTVSSGTVVNVSADIRNRDKGDPSSGYLILELNGNTIFSERTPANNTWMTVNTGNIDITSSGTLRVIIRNYRDGEHAWFDNIIVNFQSAPSAPTVISYTNKTHNSVTLRWNPENDADSYKLYVSTNSFFSNHISGYNGKSISGTSHNLTGLNRNNTYYYRLKAVNSSGESSYSGTHSVSNLLPNPPTSTSATWHSSGGFLANWNASPGATNYSVWVSGLPYEIVTSSTSALISDLPPNSNHTYKVKAQNSEGLWGSYGNTISARSIELAEGENLGENYFYGGSSEGWSYSWNSFHSGLPGLTTVTLREESYSRDFSVSAGDTINVSIEMKNDTGESRGRIWLDFNETRIFSGRTPANNNWGLVNSGKIYIPSSGTLTVIIRNNHDDDRASFRNLNVSISGPPLAPKRIYVTNKTSNALELDGFSVSGATSYKLYVSTNSSFSDHIAGYNGKSITVSPYTLTGLNPGAQYYYRARAVNSYGDSPYTLVEGTRLFAVPPIATGATEITSSGFKANWQPSEAAEDYWVSLSGPQTGPHSRNGTTTLTSYSFSGLEPNTSYTYQVRAANSDGDWGSYGNSVSFKTKLLPPVLLNSSNVTHNSFTANWNPIEGATSFLLYVSTNSSFSSHVPGYNGKSVSGTSHTVTNLDGSTYYYRIKYSTESNSSDYSNTRSVSDFLAYPPEATAATDINPTGFRANWNPASRAVRYRVSVSGFDDLFTVFGTSLVISGLDPNTQYTYRVRAENSNEDWGSYGNTISVTTRDLADTYNYVKRFTAKKENLQDLSSEEEVEQVSVQTDFYDGLGRPIQSIVKQSSPGKNDQVSITEYDNQSRESKFYLPYIENQTSGGYINKSNWEANQPSFYESLFSDDGNYSFSETTYDESPLSRVTRQKGPGLRWNNKPIKTDYEVLGAGSGIIEFRINTSGQPYQKDIYSAGDLTFTTTFDENNRRIREYKNNRNQVILKEVQENHIATMFMQTYYVYDDFGLLRFVFQPELLKQLSISVGQVIPSLLLEHYAFEYKYNDRQLLTEKKVPGAEVVYLIYDQWDRLVLTQDGNQRTNNEYNYIKYDNFNRPVEAGTHTNAGSLSSIRSAVENSNIRFETLDSSTESGYSNLTYPQSNTDPLTAIYYDDYSFSFSNQIEFDFTEELGNANPMAEVKGYPTASKTRNLVTNEWIKSINYYDDRYRLIQSISDDPRGVAFMRGTNKYDFIGNLLESQTTYTSEDLPIKKSYQYDHADRLLSVSQTIPEVEALTLADQAGISYENGIVTRASEGNGWNAGFSSFQKIPAGEDGYLEVIASENNKRRMFGLSENSINHHYKSIKYAVYLWTSSRLRVYENGAYKGQFGTYQAGDIIRVERIGNKVYYKKNGVVFYTSTIPWEGKLIADASLYDHGATINSPKVAVIKSTKILENTYNELGELINKDLHVSLDENDEKQLLQSVDYRYNIRGWLTSINNSDLAINPSNNDDDNDLFGMELSYTDGIGTPQFNGNISGISWNNALAETGSAYAFEYDPLSRLTQADYLQGSSGIYIPTNNAYGVELIDYDANGNILQLNRKGKMDDLVQNMDLLGYTYQGNQLMSVSDAGTVEGFKDGNTSGDDYAYDDNGNMVQDLNKGITSIEYNYLNLPEIVTFNDGKAIKYTYDAAGTKLKQEVFEGGLSNEPTKTTDYIGNLVFENGTLQFAQHEEGRVVFNSPPSGGAGGGIEYQYNLTDHLGNVRMVVSADPGEEELLATMEGDTETASREESQFLNLNSTTRISNPSAAHSGDEVVWVDNVNKVGPATFIKVYPGDTLTMEAYSYFGDGGSGYSNPIPFSNFLNDLNNTFSSVATSAESATQLYNGLEAALLFAGVTGSELDTWPGAYLNYIFLDNDFNFNSGGPHPLGYKQIENTPGTVSKVELDGKVVVEKEGYIFAYLSNESNTTNLIYFDDFKMTIKKSPIVQATNYYPFGLAHHGQFNRQNSPFNKYQYNGFELDDELGFGLYDYQARYYDPVLGRFINVDPAADLMRRHSPYNYAFDNPIRFIDPDGMVPELANKLNSNLNLGTFHKWTKVGQDCSICFNAGSNNSGISIDPPTSEELDDAKSGDVVGTGDDKALVMGVGEITVTADKTGNFDQEGGVRLESSNGGVDDGNTTARNPDSSPINIDGLGKGGGGKLNSGQSFFKNMAEMLNRISKLINEFTESSPSNTSSENSDNLQNNIDASEVVSNVKKEGLDTVEYTFPKTIGTGLYIIDRSTGDTIKNKPPGSNYFFKRGKNGKLQF
ncbi:MAG: fibronectin type III domain-containing protein [Bacteroidota bacterium]